VKGKVTTFLSYIGIGSNVGNRLHYCRQAVLGLQQPSITVTKVSSLYESDPVDYIPQAKFYNAVIEVETPLDPFALLRQCQQIEQALEKKITIPKGPRTIDLDILFYLPAISITKDSLTIPHPSALKRLFVLIPLAEIAPGFIPPSSYQTIKAILSAMPTDPSCKKAFDQGWANESL